MRPFRVPILTYHQVGRFTPAEVRRQRGNYVDADRFAAQVRMLHRLGFEAVTLARFSEPRSLPHRPVIFTFDDAYANIQDHAFPILSAHGWPATTFVVSGEVGGVNRWDLPKGIASAPLLEASELRKLIAFGWEIGAHSRTHPRLTELAPERLREEIAGSRADLEALLPQAVSSWCYPFGAVNAQVVAAVRSAGFQTAVTLQAGVASSTTSPLLLPRVHVGYRLGLTCFLWRFLTARTRRNT